MKVVKAMKILFVCNTPSQMIYATNIILNNLDKDCVVDMIVSDQFKNSLEIAQKYEKTGVVNKVFYAKAHDCIARGKKNLLSFFLKSSRYGLFDVLPKLENYDGLFVNNIDIFTTVLFDYLQNKNKNIFANRFEEGYSSYFSTLRQSKQCKMLEKILKAEKRRLLSESLTAFWYFEPDFAKYKHENDCMKKISPLDRNDKKLQSVLNSAFAINTLSKYDEKYIFFEESYVINGIDVDDVGLVEKIVSLVDKNDVIIRMHPRMSENRFKHLGVKTCEPDGTPWEMIQFNEDYSSKVFLTISSGSVLGSKMYFGDNVKTILLYKLVGKKIISDEYENHLRKITDKYGADGFYIPETFEELKDILERE